MFKVIMKRSCIQARWKVVFKCLKIARGIKKYFAYRDKKIVSIKEWILEMRQDFQLIRIGMF